MEKKMTKREKLREAYRMLKAGWTLKYGTALCFIGVCEICGSPSYGKEYIYWEHYGRSAVTVSMRNFKWLLDVIFKIEDYSDYVLED